MVYFICGHKGSGKSYLMNQIKESVDCNVFDTGPILREEYKKSVSNCAMSFGDWLKTNEKIYGNDYTNFIICKNMDLDLNKTNIIIGNRSMIGIKYIINYFEILNYKICFIDGNLDLFRLNYNKRENLNLNENEFKKILEIEKSMGIEEIENIVKKNVDTSFYFYKEYNDDTILQTILDDIKNQKKVKYKI